MLATAHVNELRVAVGLHEEVWQNQQSVDRPGRRQRRFGPTLWSTDIGSKAAVNSARLLTSDSCRCDSRQGRPRRASMEGQPKLRVGSGRTSHEWLMHRATLSTSVASMMLSGSIRNT